MPKKKTGNTDLEAYYSKLNDKFGDGSIIDANDMRSGYLTSGVLPLDLVVPYKGLPIGKLIQIIGPEGSGKTSLILSILAEFQKLIELKDKESIIYGDFEFRFDTAYANKCGVDTSSGKVKLLHGLWGEANLEMVEDLMRSGKVKVVAMDSMAALAPKKEVEKEMDEETVGLQAKLITKALRKLLPVAYRTETTIIVANQIREKIGVTWGGNESIPGGRMLKHYSSLIFDVRKIETLKKQTTIKNKSRTIIYGQKSRLKIKKGLGGEGREKHIYIYYGKGIHKGANLLDLAYDCGVINKNGNTYEYEKEKLGLEKSAAALLNDTDELYDEVKNKVVEIYDEYNL